MWPLLHRKTMGIWFTKVIPGWFCIWRELESVEAKALVGGWEGETFYENAERERALTVWKFENCEGESDIAERERERWELRGEGLMSVFVKDFLWACSEGLEAAPTRNSTSHTQNTWVISENQHLATHFLYRSKYVPLGVPQRTPLSFLHPLQRRVVGGDIGGLVHCNGWMVLNIWFPCAWYPYINSITMSMSSYI